jgi:hypothetical protein
MIGTRLAALVSVLGLAMGSLPTHLVAEGYEDRRAEAGVRLFRAMLAADLDLTQKVLPDGRLLVVFVHADDRKRAEELQKAFAKADAKNVPEPIHALPLVVEATPDSALPGFAGRVPGGIFIAEPLQGDRLRQVVQFGIAHHVIVFSPFEGNVESGVAGGLVVEAQVRPFVNLRTLTASNISLKDFFLKVAKVQP